MTGKRRLAVALVVGGLSLGGSVFAKEAAEAHKDLDIRDVAGQAKVSLQQAVTSARQAVPGQVVGAELEGEQHGEERRVFFDVTIIGKDGTVYAVTVNPADGKVLTSGKEEAADEIQEARAASRALKRGHLGVDAALTKAGGVLKSAVPVELEFGTYRHQPACQVRYLRGGDLFDVVLELRAGDLLALRQVRERRNGEDDDDEGDAGDHGDDDDDDHGKAGDHGDDDDDHHHRKAGDHDDDDDHDDDAGDHGDDEGDAGDHDDDDHDHGKAGDHDDDDHDHGKAGDHDDDDDDDDHGDHDDD